jgi:hypothetical protein
MEEEGKKERIWGAGILSYYFLAAISEPLCPTMPFLS